MTYEEFFATDEMPDVIAEIGMIMDDAGFDFSDVVLIGAIFDDPAACLGPEPIEGLRDAFELVAEKLDYLSFRHQGLKEECRLDELAIRRRSQSSLKLATVNGENVDINNDVPMPVPGAGPATSRIANLVAAAMSTPHGIAVLGGRGVSMPDDVLSNDMTAQAVFNAVTGMSEYDLVARVAYLEGLYRGHTGRWAPAGLVA